ncbi:hypothetical protein PL597_13560 [Agrobacterium sp. ST15.13.013]|nr:MULTISPECIES: hypothetical protein [Agrobacterium]MDA5639202.1 hypothetical protein [Agrobacterium sp. ST15.13.013]MDA6998863.1 hypothetical protein [Agrobacterium salinitolerans]
MPRDFSSSKSWKQALHRQPFPKAVSIVLMIGIMRLLINILLFILGAVGSGICAFLLSAALADSGFLGSCFEGNCAYAALFMVLPVTWFVLFALYVMALLIWRRKPFRNGRL